MPWPASADAIVGALLALAVAAGQAWLVLPRLAIGRGAAVTGALVIVAGLAAILLPERATAPLASVAVGLVAGHLGWLAGRRRRAARASQADDTQAPAPHAAAPAAAAPGDAAEPTGPTPPPATDRLATPPVGLGPYRVERLLGRGSMGAVYLARDSRSGARVALKTLSLGRDFHGEALAEAHRRFVREAATTGRLRHADIVAVLDTGQAGDDAYIAMEYVPGHDLVAHSRPDRLLPVPVVAETVARVADALAYAHRQGVVHRDVKPANVMLDIVSGSVKVTDFGVARVAADASRTRTGVLLGTPAFMSPEQLAGDVVDGRSDLYSLGVVLFQLLTGALPHESESMAVMMRRIAQEPAPDVRSERADLPAELARVVAKALAKRPGDRHADGAAMAADLRAAVARRGGGAALSQPSAAAEIAPVAEVMPSADSVTFTSGPAWERPDTRHNSPA